MLKQMELGPVGDLKVASRQTLDLVVSLLINLGYADVLDQLMWQRLSRRFRCLKTDDNIAEWVARKFSEDSSSERCLAGWTLCSILGEGTFSTVLKAKRLMSSLQCAVKITDTQHYNARATNRSSKLRPDTEASILRALTHENIMGIYEAYHTTRGVILMLEYCEHGDVCADINQRGAYGNERTTNLCLQVGSALAYLHCNWIIHRDVKPENVLLKSTTKCDVVFVLADFGLARKCGFMDACRTFVGTQPYMAPEIFRTYRGNANGYGSKVDVWSLGITIHACLTSELPSSVAITDAEIGSNHLSEVREGIAEASDLLRLIILTCLEPDPASRRDMCTAHRDWSELFISTSRRRTFY